MLKPFICSVSLVALAFCAAAEEKAPVASCDLEQATTVINLDACPPIERPFTISNYTQVTVGAGDGRWPVRYGDHYEEAGTVFSYSKGVVSLHGQLTYSNERKFNTRYLFADIGTGDYGVRFGRVQHLLGYYNQNRNVTGLADFLMPPPTLYREAFRDMASSGDGFQAYATWDVKGWEVRTQVTEAKPILYPEKDLMDIFTFDPVGSKFEDSSRIHGFNLTISSPHKEVIARYDRQHLDIQMTALKPFRPQGDQNSIVHTAGVRWAATKNLDLTAEYVWVDAFGSAQDQIVSRLYRKGINIGYILSARWHPAPKWEVNAYIDYYCLSSEDCNGQEQRAFYRNTKPASAFNAKSRGLFVRHTLSKNWHVAGQYTQGEGMIAHIKSDTTQKPAWETLMLSVGYMW